MYDTQGTINVGDFDFDGEPDFAVQADERRPRTGGPTFRVFLFSKKLGRFVLSEPLSKLTEESLGFFEVDASSGASARSRRAAAAGTKPRSVWSSAVGRSSSRARGEGRAHDGVVETSEAPRRRQVGRDEEAPRRRRTLTALTAP